MRTLARLLTLELRPRRRRHELLCAPTRAPSVFCCTDACAHTPGSFTQRTSWPSARMRLAVDGIEESKGSSYLVGRSSSAFGLARWCECCKTERPGWAQDHEVLECARASLGKTSAQHGHNAIASVGALQPKIVGKVSESVYALGHELNVPFALAAAGCSTP